MNAHMVYGDLKRLCDTLDASGDHAIAAHLSLCMSLLQEKYDLGISGTAVSQEHATQIKA